MKTIVKIQQ